MTKHTITLPDGYKSRDPKDGSLNRVVEFGKRPTAADQIKIDNNSQSGLEVQRTLLYARDAITAFGSMERFPPPLSLLMGLSSRDRDAMVEGYVDFLGASLGDRVADSLSEHEHKLAFGLEIEGEAYDVLVFGGEDKQYTGYDDLKVEKQYGTGLKRDLAYIGRDVCKLAQSEGGLTVEGEVSADALTKLDMFDVGKLVEFYAQRRGNFRKG